MVDSRNLITFVNNFFGLGGGGASWCYQLYRCTNIRTYIYSYILCKRPLTLERFVATCEIQLAHLFLLGYTVACHLWVGSEWLCVRRLRLGGDKCGRGGRRCEVRWYASMIADGSRPCGVASGGRLLINSAKETAKSVAGSVGSALWVGSWSVLLLAEGGSVVEGDMVVMVEGVRLVV